MNPPAVQPQQPQVSTITSGLPSGVESVFIGYSYYGRPRVMMTLQHDARRKLMVFAVMLLVLGPLIVISTTVCIAMSHYWLAYGYVAGTLIRGVMALAIQCSVWSLILFVVAVIIPIVVEENKTVVTIVFESLLALVGLLGGILCLTVSIKFCKVTCCTTYAATAAHCNPAMYPPHVQQVFTYNGPQQQQMPPGPQGYNTAQQWAVVGPPGYQPQQPSASNVAPAPPSYDSVNPDHKV